MERKGFTLIELLVVVAIVAILMAVLMPAMQRAREPGKRAVCLGNVKPFGLSWVLYADENDQRMVFLDEDKTSTQSGTIFHDRASWWDLPPVRHGAGTNLGFADGHAEYWKWQDLRTLKVARQEGNWQSFVNVLDNPDIPRVQRAAWSQLGYTPQQ